MTNRRELIPSIFKPLANFPSLGRFPAFWEDFEDAVSAFSQSKELTLSEDKKNVYVEAAVPGFKKENVEVTLDKGILQIKAEKKETEENKELKIYRKASDSYFYQVALPSQIDESKSTAEIENGVIKLTFQKAPQSQAKKIAIKQK